jgi:ketosteroid isomerase-like protein
MAYQNIVQELYDARSKSDLERMMTFLHPDGVFHIVGSEHLSPLTQRLEGAHLVRPVAGQLLSDWDMSRVENIDVHESGDTVYVHRRGNVVYTPDGSSLDTEFIDKLTFRDGKIVEYLQFLDTYAVARFMAEKQPLQATG